MWIRAPASPRRKLPLSRNSMPADATRTARPSFLATRPAPKTDAAAGSPGSSAMDPAAAVAPSIWRITSATWCSKILPGILSPPRSIPPYKPPMKKPRAPSTPRKPICTAFKPAAESLSSITAGTTRPSHPPTPSTTTTAYSTPWAPAAGKASCASIWFPECSIASAVPAPAQRQEHGIYDALEQWVEKGAAPGAIVATKYVEDNSAKGVRMTRPLCPYPQIAVYKGAGDSNDYTNFDCMTQP